MIGTILLSSLLFSQNLEGHWEGAATFRGNPWPITLDVESSGEALLDIPSMLYFQQKAPSKVEGGRLIIELPFRFGQVPLERKGSNLTGATKFLDESLGVSLKKTERKAAFKTRDIEFRSGSLLLKGTLFLPNTPGPHPAAVQIHGAGPRGRTSWSYVGSARYLASRGVVTLAYDKRPYDDIYPDLKDLAADAEAAFQFLKAQPEVDPSNVGLTGGSQAGWIMSRISATAKPAWIHGTSLPANPPGENEHWVQMTIAERTGGATTEQLLRLDSYLALFFLSSRTGNHFAELAAQGQQLPDEKWTKGVEVPTQPDHLGWWTRNMDFEFGRLWKGIKVPMVALYGSDDVYVDPYGDPARLRARVPGVQTRTIPGADHRLELRAGTVNGKWRWPQMAPEYFTETERFLKERVKAKPVR